VSVAVFKRLGNTFHHIFLGHGRGRVSGGTRGTRDGTIGTGGTGGTGDTGLFGNNGGCFRGGGTKGLLLLFFRGLRRDGGDVLSFFIERFRGADRTTERAEKDKEKEETGESEECYLHVFAYHDY
jgi:hypothetical protein